MTNETTGANAATRPRPNQIMMAVRQQAVRDRMLPNSLAIFVSNPERTRSNDTEHAYRQNSDILYLNGFPEPESVLVISRVGGKDKRIMFVRPKDRAREIWTGIRQGVAGAKKNYMADEAYPIDQFAKVVGKLLGKADAVYYRFKVNPEFDEKFRQLWEGDQKDVLNPDKILHELRLFKDPSEADLIRHAATITARAHSQAMAATRCGQAEYELQAVLEHEFTRSGASGLAYTSIVAGGNNAVVLHYVENRGFLADGDLVLVDAACEYEGYASDITRTWPVNGKFSAPQAEIYQAVLDAQMAALKLCRPGMSLRRIHLRAADVMRRHLKELGILPATSSAAADRKIEKQKLKDKKGPSKKSKAKKPATGQADVATPAVTTVPDAQAPSKRAAKPTYPLTVWDFFPHGTSHWMGLDVHDVGSYDEPGKVKGRNTAAKKRKLEAGMVFTVEPGLYFDKSDKRVDKKYRGIGVRIEDDVLITASGCEVLTAGVPKAIADVESLMASAR
jgi:Xaa-Pro aminopeptidase